MTMSLIQTVTVGAGGSSLIEFTGIPQDADDLVVLMSPRLSSAGFSVRARFNSDTGTTYSYLLLRGNGSSVASQIFGGQTGMFFGIASGGTDTASAFGNMSLYIPNYRVATFKRCIANSVSANAGDTYPATFATAWNSNSAITTVSLTPESTATFQQHTTASLYKIKKF